MQGPFERDRNAIRVGSLVYHGFVSEAERDRRRSSLPSGWHAPLVEDFVRQMNVLDEMKANPITYDQLHDWHTGKIELPAGSLTIDFDNALACQYRDAYPILAEHGWVANLAINTQGVLQQDEADANDPDRQQLTWDEVAELQRNGWCLCSHTHTHPQMSDLADKDPGGAMIEQELLISIRVMKEKVGVRPVHFVYVGRGWNELGESIVKKHFKTGRLWVADMTYFLGGGKEVPVGEILGAGDVLEADGGPPMKARYFTRESSAYRIPALDASNLVFTSQAMRAWADGLF